MDIAIQKAKEAGIGWVACKGEMHIILLEPFNLCQGGGGGMERGMCGVCVVALTSVRVQGVGWTGGQSVCVVALTSVRVEGVGSFVS